MPKRAQPTVRKRRLAATLRSLRDQAGVSPEQVMEELDWSRSKVSKVETANMGVSVPDVRVLCELYGADHKITEWLVKTARDAKRRGWWASYNDAMPSIFEDYVELESEATCAHYFEIDLIPGLLQTADYAVALMETTSPEAVKETTRARAELRMRRQERLLSGEMSLWAIIDESALLRGTGTAETRSGQIRRLLDAMDLQNVVLQILPLRAGSHPASGSPFGQLHFPEPIPSVVFVDNVAGSLYIEEPDEVARFSTAFDHLRATAVDARESRKLLTAALKAVDAER
ncbi:helix-turn-helix domain-containing protein [Saccharopolyspora hattusasensis]|uniref:helix-turn-helix domain-containing protein n=1 Tax=Saccharopolyspora hattusasensis TaxID=1128679 RepID=UPI003D965E37